MHGMFWAGLLLSSIPLALGIAVGIYALRRWRESGGSPPEPGPARPRAEPPARS